MMKLVVKFNLGDCTDCELLLNDTTRREMSLDAKIQTVRERIPLGDEVQQVASIEGQPLESVCQASSSAAAMIRIWSLMV